MADESVHDDEHLGEALRAHRNARAGQGPAPDTAGQGPDSSDEQGSSETPPWGEEFTPERAWNSLQAARSNEERLRNRLRDLESESTRRNREGLSEKQRIQALEDELRGMRFEADRSRVAIAKGLPSDAVKFLDGESPEELERKADELLALIGGAQPAMAAAPDFGAGARPTGNGVTEDDFSSVIRRSAGRPR
jgi:hypothetical protein